MEFIAVVREKVIKKILCYSSRKTKLMTHDKVNLFFPVFLFGTPQTIEFNGVCLVTLYNRRQNIVIRQVSIKNLISCHCGSLSGVVTVTLLTQNIKFWPANTKLSFVPLCVKAYFMPGILSRLCRFCDACDISSSVESAVPILSYHWWNCPGSAAAPDRTSRLDSAFG